jgi:arabinogalactan endo-1,4-beta-galactosidase
MIFRIPILILAFSCLISCSREEETKPIETSFINAADLSSVPEIESYAVDFYNFDGEKEDILITLKNAGINTVRLRIWNNPPEGHCNLKEVTLFSRRIRSLGMKVWLTVHYSDTWADPASQAPPEAWQGIPFNSLKDSVYNFTTRIMTEIHPEYIQIGNEVNNGFLFPYGDRYKNEKQFIELLETGIKAVKEHGKAVIFIHYAGIKGSDEFFETIKDINYDMIGLSYYPIWHGKDLQLLGNTLNELSKKNNKKIVIAETSYPFTLQWNDLTHNVVGMEEQLILPEFPATPEGQRDFLKKIKSIVRSVPYGSGLCYWGGELVAFKGPDSQNGSSWENQALYDFNNKALPVIKVFGE